MNLANVRIGPHHVYIAARAVADTPIAIDSAGTAWKDVGAVENGEITITGDVLSFETQLGSQQAGIDMKAELTGLESDDTQVTLLNGFINHLCDILIVPVVAANTNCLELLKYVVNVGVTGKISKKSSFGFKITATKPTSDLTGTMDNVVVAWRI